MTGKSNHEDLEKMIKRMDEHQRINTKLKISKWGRYVTVRKEKVEFIDKSKKQTISRDQYINVDELLEKYKCFHKLFQ